MHKLKCALLSPLAPLTLGLATGVALGGAPDGQEPVTEKGPYVLSICTEGWTGIERTEKVKASMTMHVPLDGRTPIAGSGFCSPQFLKGGRSIKIKRRGFSSDRFAKKQYGIEVFTDGKEVEASFLDMPAASKWALYGPYVDRSYLRNAVAYQVGRKLGELRNDAWFAPRSRFVEIYLNEDFQGLYMLSEKVQRGENQLDIPKMTLKHPDPASYILEISRMTSDFKTKHGTPVEYSYPSRKKLEKWEKANPDAADLACRGILADVEAFEDALVAPTFADPELGYRPYIDVDSFVDFLIAKEAFKDIDGFRRSAFFYKGNDGKVHMGPLWDFNIAMGNIRMFDGADAGGWIHGQLPLYTKPVFWFKRLLQDQSFVAQVQERYEFLRQPGMPLHMGEIRADIVGFIGEMGEAPLRDQTRWQGTQSFIEKHILATKKKGHSYVQHIRIMENWLAKRLSWMDRNMPRIGRPLK